MCVLLVQTTAAEQAATTNQKGRQITNICDNSGINNENTHNMRHYTILKALEYKLKVEIDLIFNFFF